MVNTNERAKDGMRSYDASTTAFVQLPLKVLSVPTFPWQAIRYCEICELIC